MKKEQNGKVLNTIAKPIKNNPLTSLSLFAKNGKRDSNHIFIGYNPRSFALSVDKRKLILKKQSQ
ncbi:hypothetical protein [Vibrio bathopelagicus]